MSMINATTPFSIMMEVVRRLPRKGSETWSAWSIRTRVELQTKEVELPMQAAEAYVWGVTHVDQIIMDLGFVAPEARNDWLKGRMYGLLDRSIKTTMGK